MWRLLLIGGSSGTGKTAVGQELIKSLGISLVLVDDIRLAIQAVTTQEHNSALHTFVAEGSQAMNSPKSVLDGLTAVAEAMESALRIVITHHLVVPGTGAIIIEGDGILPQLVSPQRLSRLDEFQGIPVAEMVRAVFLYEEDKGIIRENMMTRGRGYQDMSREQQQALTEGSWLFGQYLIEQAMANGLPAVRSRPFDTLTERVLAAMDVGNS
jgi:2-phosphoglycerate kinase